MKLSEIINESLEIEGGDCSRSDIIRIKVFNNNTGESYDATDIELGQDETGNEILFIGYDCPNEPEDSDATD